VFTLTAADVRDVSAFSLAFPTGIRPAVGRHLTCPQGSPPQAGCDEALLTSLVSLGDIASAGRHCELTATARNGGRMRSYRFSGGVWRTDVFGEPSLSTATLRQTAEGPISFLCATIGSGARLGGDRDEDAVLNGNDCAVADAGSWSPPLEVSGALLSGKSPTQLVWSDPSLTIGPGVRFDVVSGSLSSLRSGGLVAATSCLAANVAGNLYADARPSPPAGDGFYYLIRSENACGSGTFGPGRAGLDPLTCP
jgi:hypothetical protein